LCAPQPFGTQARRAMLVVLGSVGMAVTLTTPLAYTWVGQVSGVPNLARPISHAAMLVILWAAIRTLEVHLHPDPVRVRNRRWHTWWLLGTLSMMAVLFVLADTPVDDVRFAARYSHTPLVLEYWLVYVSYLLPAFVMMLRLSLQYIRLSINPSLSVGLRFIVVGTVFSAIYHGHKAVFFAFERAGVSYPPAIRAPLDTIFPLISTILVAIGIIIPAWGPYLGLPRMLAWVQRYRTFQGLRPLWRALYRASPEIALVPPTTTLFEVLAPRDLDLRLYRRVIEIRDGRLALLPYLDSTVAAEARRRATATGFAGQRLEAFVEAAVLYAAVTAKSAGTKPGHEAPAVMVPGGGDLDTDTAFLQEVARAFPR
jgi:hypothetical protein